MQTWQEWLKDIVELGMWLGAACAVWWKLFDYLEKKAKEKSVGAEKVSEFVKKHTKFEHDIQMLQDHDKEHSDEIKEIRHDAREMLKMVLDFFKK